MTSFCLPSQHHEKTVEEKKRVLAELHRSTRGRDYENGALSRELEELNVSTNERRHIHEVNGMCIKLSVLAYTNLRV